MTVALYTEPLLTLSANSDKPRTNLNDEEYNGEFGSNRYEDWNEDDEEW